MFFSYPVDMSAVYVYFVLFALIRNQIDLTSLYRVSVLPEFFNLFHHSISNVCKYYHTIVYIYYTYFKLNWLYSYLYLQATTRHKIFTNKTQILFQITK